MGSILPLIFTVLALSPGDEGQPLAPDILISGPAEIEMIARVDSVAESGDVMIVASDVMATDGASRRILTLENPDGSIFDIMDGGPWGGDGFFEDVYITDRKSDTLSGILEIADASPVFSIAPEGGTMIEFTDRLKLTVLNHDTAENYEFILRDNQIFYKVDDRRFKLMSVRPKPNDLEELTRFLRIYNPDGENPDDPLTAAQLSSLVSSLYPLPGKAIR